MVAPASITPNSPASARRVYGLLGSVLIAVIMVVAILVLAIPRLSAAVAFFPFSERYYVVFNVMDGSEAKNRRYVAHARAAAGFFESYRIYNDISLAEFHLLEVSKDRGTAARALLAQASRDIVESIALGPANPNVWIRLAVARRFSGAPPESVRKALFTSILLGPNEPSLLSARIRLGIAYWRYLTADERREISNLVHFAMEEQAYHRVIADLSGDVWSRAVIQTALADDPRLLGIYVSMLPKLRR